MAQKAEKNVFLLIDITIDMIFFSINWINYFDRSTLVISMTVLLPCSLFITKNTERTIFQISGIALMYKISHFLLQGAF